MPFFRRSFAPVREGEEVDVTIEAVGEKGDGIGKVKGFVIFVPNTKQGDKVRIKITRVLRKVGFGEAIGPASGKPASAESSDKEPNKTEESGEEKPEPVEGEDESEKEEEFEEEESDSENF